MYISGSFYQIDDTYFTGTPRHSLQHNYPYEHHYYKQDERSFCEYCHGHTEIDRRGNCVACGAPKIPSGYLVR